jgi:hypothetical protein
LKKQRKMPENRPETATNPLTADLETPQRAKVNISPINRIRNILHGNDLQNESNIVEIFRPSFPLTSRAIAPRSWRKRNLARWRQRLAAATSGWIEQRIRAAKEQNILFYSPYGDGVESLRHRQGAIWPAGQRRQRHRYGWRRFRATTHTRQTLGYPLLRTPLSWRGASPLTLNIQGGTHRVNSSRPQVKDNMGSSGCETSGNLTTYDKPDLQAHR